MGFHFHSYVRFLTGRIGIYYKPDKHTFVKFVDMFVIKKFQEDRSINTGIKKF